LTDHARLKKLAARIDALAAKDEAAILKARDVARQRREGAAGLHTLCAGFVQALNSLVTKSRVSLDPAAWDPAGFLEDAPNLFQINARGRLIQIEFRATDVLVSTEEFRVPYILEGEVRCFNQDFLDRQSVEEQLLFYCLEKSGAVWRFFDPRTYRSGLFDEAFLVALMEQLV
jgi:hypothetical protein